MKLHDKRTGETQSICVESTAPIGARFDTVELSHADIEYLLASYIRDVRAALQVIQRRLRPGTPEL